ncbi:hypothetical protein [Paenibacillus azoreducens]|uniref:Uncharacterized protein n=1 Tax=Paenibacillus azoreducens TaxID=116718 RepID=A0A920CT37_9BACL|nr:hypothetical protein [Paenibacillus azoreducens]GIO47997.1 hypothetical protein J34TS1_27620 [Paenibacillus azoreducens]
MSRDWQHDAEFLDKTVIGWDRLGIKTDVLDIAVHYHQQYAAEKARADKAEAELEQVRQSTRFWYIQLKNKEHSQKEELLAEHIIEVEDREQKLKENIERVLKHDNPYGALDILEQVVSTLYPKEEADHAGQGY